MDIVLFRCMSLKRQQWDRRLIFPICAPQCSVICYVILLSEVKWKMEGEKVVTGTLLCLLWLDVRAHLHEEPRATSCLSTLELVSKSCGAQRKQKYNPGTNSVTGQYVSVVEIFFIVHYTFKKKMISRYSV